MDEQNYIVEDHGKPSWLLPLVGLLVFVIGGFIFYYFTYYLADVDSAPETTIVAEEIEPVTFNEPLSEAALAHYQSQIAGHLYFSAEKKDSETGALGQYSIYSYNLAAENELNTVARDLFYADFAPIDSSQGVFASVLEADEASIDFTHPTLLKYEEQTMQTLNVPALYTEQDLAVSPNGQFLAYAGQTQLNKAADARTGDLKDWQVVIHNFATEENTVLTEAARPQWFNDGADIVYLKPNGVYRYNLATKEEVQILDEYDNLHVHMDLAVSADSTRLIMTIPDFYLINLYDVSASGELSIFQRVAIPDSLFFDPVFSPDGKFYAVTSVGKGAINPDQTLEDINVEIRIPQNSSVIKTFEPEGFNFSNFNLGIWSNEAFKI